MRSLFLILVNIIYLTKPKEQGIFYLNKKKKKRVSERSSIFEPSVGYGLALDRSISENQYCKNLYIDMS